MPVAFHVLTTGYAHDRVAGTVTLLTEDDTVAVVDPGMVADRRLTLGPLARLGIEPQEGRGLQPSAWQRLLAGASAGLPTKQVPCPVPRGFQDPND